VAAGAIKRDRCPTIQECAAADNRAAKNGGGEQHGMTAAVMVCPLNNATALAGR
jgi:hypothetical protein